MLSIHANVIFFVASVGLALSPGPDNVFVLMQSVLHGRRAGLLVFGPITLFSGFLKEHVFKSVLAQTVLNPVAALVFLGLAVRLLVSKS